MMFKMEQNALRREAALRAELDAIPWRSRPMILKLARQSKMSPNCSR